MASGRLLVPSWMPALDGNGDPISGVKAYFYVNMTTTLAPVYSDEGLTTPLANPVEANSAGRFPAIWADADVLYSVAIEAPYGPAGVPFSYDNLSVSLGAEIATAEATEAAADDAAISLAAIQAALDAAIENDGSAAAAGAAAGTVAGEAAANAVVDLKANKDASGIVASTWRTALELGTSALLDTGRAAANVATVSVTRDENPDLPMRQFMAGHEADADHTARFQEAIDKISQVAGQTARFTGMNRGGTIQLDAETYNIAGGQLVLSSFIPIIFKGASAGDGNGLSTVLRPLGNGAMFQFGLDNGASGYRCEGSGLRDVTIKSEDGDTSRSTSGAIVKIFRQRDFLMDNIRMWGQWDGIDIYGSMLTTLRKVNIEQVRGGKCIEFRGDITQRSDILTMNDVFLGAQYAATGSRAKGFVWHGFAHTVEATDLKIVNPSKGLHVYKDGNNMGQNPNIAAFHNLQIDFASEEVALLSAIRRAKFDSCYFHSAGTTGYSGILAEKDAALSAPSGDLAFAKCSFSGAYENQLRLSCDTVFITHNTILPVVNTSGTMVSLQDGARRIVIDTNIIGSHLEYTAASTQAGVGISTDTDRIFYDGHNLNSGPSGYTPMANFSTGANNIIRLS